ncbi:(R)-citramalate synthase CimA [Candidatus Gugararchaeum adminiculabundum]|nr:(R)-citramalate synthase CimA [Candidatus Gugararchaeum adminiculabundum]
MLILDTTLRDGEQTPGVSLTLEKRMAIARKLDEIGVDIIELGSACASVGEKQAMKAIVKEGLRADTSSFARAMKKDIDDALGTDVNTLSLVVPTSDLHIEKKLKKTKQEVVALTGELVTYAKAHGLKVEVLAEDGSRTEFNSLVEIFSAGIAAKADRVCVCDTVGVWNPEITFGIYKLLVEKLKVPVAFHGHNDLGLGVANSLAAFRGGASELHVTVNGLGERAGNCPLEELALDLKYFYDVRTVELKKLSELSKVVETLTGLTLHANKPLVGDNAFAHESGIHVDGVLKHASTYEPITPEMVGQKRRFSFGKHSGRAGVKAKVEQMGVRFSDTQLERAIAKVKELGDKGKEVTDADLHAIVYDILGEQHEAKVKLEEFTAFTGNRVTPTASVKLKINGEVKVVAGIGDGPVDAAISAIEKALGGTNVKLTEYKVDAITGGANALVHVKVKMKKGDREVSASAAETDIVMASVEAVLRGINLLI